MQIMNGNYPFNSPHTYGKHRPANEPGGGLSMTIPDQTMSLRELLERYARGLPLDEHHPGIFDDENQDPDDFDTLPDIRKMDLADLEAYKIRYKEELAAIQARLRPEDIPHEEVEKPAQNAPEGAVTVP